MATYDVSCSLQYGRCWPTHCAQMSSHLLNMATAPKWLEGLGTNHPGEPAPAFLGWLPFQALIKPASPLLQ